MDEETRYEAIRDAQAEADAEMQAEEKEIEELQKDRLTEMFADIEMKLKAIAETLQGQIEEIRQRIDEIDKDIVLHEKLFDVHHTLWLDCKSRIEMLEKKNGH